MDARTKLTDAWPLFALRLRTEHLVLRMPTDDDLATLLQVAKAGIHPPDEMPFGVAWTLVEGEAFDRNFMQFNWRTRATFAPGAWDLNMLVELDGRPIGAQSIAAEDFAIHRTVHTGSWLGRKHQGRGFGKEMRAAVLGFAFDGLGARVAETSAFLDNGPSNGVTRALGYEENGLGSLAPQGVARVTQKFRMTAEGWRSRPRPALVIEGLDGIRDLFGAEEPTDRA
jgi:RimJ/RimL family protein N-acetyltransferase